MTTQTDTTVEAKLYARIERMVADLNEALGLDPSNYSNRVSFGYLGNCGPGFDDRSWMVFLPHPGRPGTYADQIGSFRTGDVDGMAALVSQLAGALKIAKLIRS